VTVSDWHGQLEPFPVNVEGRRRLVGGAAVLASYFRAERERNPGGTLVMAGGDSFGATPPLSSFLEDVPAVEAQNAMGVDIDALGNHNFDHGLPRLHKLLGVARFPYVAANIVDADNRTLAPPTHVFTRRGVRIGVIGIGHPDTPELVSPDRIGAYRFLDPAPIVNHHAAALRADGADVVVVLAHMGADGVDARGMPLGPIAGLARAIRGVDLLVADHTDVSVNAVVGGVLVVENRSKGAQFSVVDLAWDARGRRLVERRASQRWADAATVTPNGSLQALVEGYRAQVQPLFDRKVGETPAVLTRSRQAESRLGNFQTDVLRAAYGAQIALVNSGGLRDDMPSSYEPANRQLRRPAPGYASGPPWDVVEADLHAVFPFHNVAVTFRVTGRALWAALEHSVGTGTVSEGRFTNTSGGFLQVSGFRFRFDPRRAAGQRVRAVTWPDGTPIPRDGREYTAVTIDFLYNGGDGYTMLRSAPGTTRELIADVVGRALRASSPAPARIEGRITEETRPAGG
jgi:5'-nucleotidase